MLNRFAQSVGERAMSHCSRLRIDLYKEDDGNIFAGFELHGSIGEFSDCEDCAEGGLKEQADLSLLRDLLDRFEQIGGAK